ncbi:unnamed protein product [Diabrotica balteata]|uniref:C2H2-type domain-containing protein n=1 Tax=Diabrotica balteata TaxID=107213 RepID=A0A9N9T793_DIABA|nr:unnamed protein product [Diabrotica balteata]
MNRLDKTRTINLYKVVEDIAISVFQYEYNSITKELISKVRVPSLVQVKFDPNVLDTRKDGSKLAFRSLDNDERVTKWSKVKEPSEVVTYVNSALNIPTMIRCQNCEVIFPTKYQYQRHQCQFNAEKVVLKSEGKEVYIENRVTYVCEICNKEFVSENNLQRHQLSHKNAQENVCEHCNKQFISDNRLRIHRENHCKKSGDISKFYRSDISVWKCNKCQQVFSSSLAANYHTASCTETVKPTYQNIQSTDTADAAECNSNTDIEKVLTEILLQCEFCNRIYTDKNILLMHQNMHTTDKNYECVKCSKVFESYVIAVQHWMKKCSDYMSPFYLPKLVYCEFCDRTFKSHELLYTHKIKRKHYTPKIQTTNPDENDKEQVSNLDTNTDKQILDKLVEDVFKTLNVPSNTINGQTEADKENIDGDTAVNIAEKKKRGRKKKSAQESCIRSKKIMLAVDNRIKYQCERCVQVFDTVIDLEEHRRTEHTSNFTCDICGQVLHSAKDMVIHSRTHQKLKPYVCETCGRSYSQTSHLWQHMRFHQGIKPFACPHEGCEARYTIRPDLKDHIRKAHTRERPFKCNVCNKCFLTGSVYYQHRLIHTNDRRYVCDICDKRFFRADALNNHRRIHTDERPYPCQVCGRKFRQKGDRNKHLRTQHLDTVAI